ncbi:MAG: hypothetical protein MUE95_02615 [Cyclobacteriaceae bacterium]|jgi:hypothetical protein|nr:hypothetical protein [Cyclobacteriaceae bacterium]
MKVKFFILIITALLLTQQGMEIISENYLPSEDTKKESVIFTVTQQKKQQIVKRVKKPDTAFPVIHSKLQQRVITNHPPAALFILHQALLL